MPGPVLTLAISETTRRGFWAGPLIVLGHAILEITLLVLLILGFADLIRKPGLLGVVGIAGGAVLLWMSFDMLRGIRHLRLDLSGGKRRSGNGGRPDEPGKPLLDHLVGDHWPGVCHYFDAIWIHRCGGLFYRAYPLRSGLVQRRLTVRFAGEAVYQRPDLPGYYRRLRRPAHLLRDLFRGDRDTASHIRGGSSPFIRLPFHPVFPKVEKQ